MKNTKFLGEGLLVRTPQRGKKTKHRDTVRYHGPMLVSQEVAQGLAASNAIYRTSHGKWVMRLESDGVVWLTREPVPDHKAMIGEVVVGHSGGIRVHLYRAVDQQPTFPHVGKLVEDALRVGMVPPVAPPSIPVVDAWSSEDLLQLIQEDA